MLRFTEQALSEGKDFRPSQFSPVAENKFTELFQYHLNGNVIKGACENGKYFWEVTLKKKVNLNVITSTIRKWVSEGYGEARYIKPNRFAPFGTVFFETAK
jgi:hypothetical protein